MLRSAKLLLSILLVTGVVACGSSEGQDSSGVRSTAEASPESAVSQPAPGTSVRPQEGSPSPSSGTEPGSRASAGDQERLPPPKHAWVIFGADTVLAELARTPEERSQGLMYRENLPKGRGMFFVFTDSQIRSFWMSNTFIPLDIAYMDAELKIVDIQAMEPQTTEGHASTLPTMFALEVPQGWFAEMGIGVGAQAKVVFGPG